MTCPEGKMVDDEEPQVFDLEAEGERIKQKIMEDCEAHFNNLNSMAEKAKYEQYRIKAIDSYFSNSIVFMRFLKYCKKDKTKKSIPSASDIVKQVEEKGVEVEF
jgi:hypothetical protein